MEKSRVGHSLSGNWRGWYMYRSHPATFAFEAVFLETGGMVDGNVLDDGKLGEASIVGSFNYPVVIFTKRYYNSRATEPVHYQGTMSEDGNVIAGSWHIKAPDSSARGTSGTWRVIRYSNEDDLEFTNEDSGELVEDKQEARPLVAPAKSR